MASEALGRKVYSVQPKDLQLAGGNWRRPTESVPTAELISATQFSVSGQMGITKGTRRAAVEFELSKTSDNFGWEEANVRIRMILSHGRELSVRVQQQFNDMKPNERTRVRAELQWPDRDLINLIFVLSDATSKSKGGLIFYGVTIREM